MKLIRLDYDFSVCKIMDSSQVDFQGEYVFLSKTNEEISLVCETTRVPANKTAVEHGWKALKIAGVLDFGMVGVISKISSILSNAEISIFVISTYNTDYILLKEHTFIKSIELLIAAGYDVI